MEHWVPLGTIPLTDPLPAFLGYLAPEPGDLTILYGDGGAGKGTLASYWAAQVTRDGGRVLIIDGEDHPTQWRRRVEEHGGDKDLVDYWPHAGGEADVENYADKFALVIMDSAAYFMPQGVDMWSPEGAVYFQRLAKRMGTHVLLLGHTSKTTPGPYGSVYFRNAPTVALGLTRDDAEDVVTLHVSKANDVGGLDQGMRWTVSLDDRRVHIGEWVEPEAKVPPAKAEAVQQRGEVRDMLEQATELSPGEVARALGVSIRVATSRLQECGAVNVAAPGLAALYRVPPA